MYTREMPSAKMEILASMFRRLSTGNLHFSIFALFASMYLFSLRLRRAERPPAGSSTPTIRLHASPRARTHRE